MNEMTSFLEKKTRGWISLVVFLMCLSLTSCAELLSTIVEDDMTVALNNAKPKSSKSKKTKEKEEKQLKQEGKCPVCHGMGKTPDGQYTCSKCNGTGKFSE
ncbi:MAG: hypothetical protein J6Y97_08995 [Prevotella sp.]|nr:hypothetical protein [Prevotella sp.]